MRGSDCRTDADDERDVDDTDECRQGAVDDRQADDDVDLKEAVAQDRKGDRSRDREGEPEEDGPIEHCVAEGLADPSVESSFLALMYPAAETEHLRSIDYTPEDPAGVTEL